MIKKTNKHIFNILIVFVAFLYKLINNLTTQKYFYGDDSWLLLGSRFDSYLEGLRCCAVTHPIFSLFAQSIYRFSGYSTEKTILSFLIFSVISALMIFKISNRLLTQNEKLLVYCLTIASPVLIQYGVRPKPYSSDVLISIFIIIIFYKIEKQPSKSYFFILGLFLLFSISSWPLIGALLLIYFSKYFYKKNFNGIFNISFFSFGFLLTIIQVYRWRDPGMQNFVIAYYAPTEGGPLLFLRWSVYSFIRFFGESNKLDLGFFNFSLLISVMLFTLGAIKLYKENNEFLLFSTLGILLNFLGAIFKLWPFGGFRTSIYLLPIFCIFVAKGLFFLTSILRNKKFENALLLFFIVFLFTTLQHPNYQQTTRPFDNNLFGNILEEFNTSNNNYLIYHGGLQTIALHSTNKIYLEDINYFEKGQGTEGFHIPFFLKNNIHIACTRYTGSDNGLSCLKQNLEFLNNFEGKQITLIGVHIRDHQFKPYVDAFENTNWNAESITMSEEVGIITFTK